MAFKPRKLRTIVQPGKSLPGSLIVALGRFFMDQFWKVLRSVVGETDLLRSIDENTPSGKPPLWTSLSKTLLYAVPFRIAKVSASSLSGSPSTSLQAMADAAATWLHPRHSKLYSRLLE